MRGFRRRGRKWTGLYKLVFFAHCGMSWDLETGLERGELVERIRHYNRRAHRRGQPVTRLDGMRWEHECPEDAGMVPDTAGTMVAKRELE